MNGISFTDTMNHAIRTGNKTMTRRIKTGDKPPYKVGDVVYIREKHRVTDFYEDRFSRLFAWVQYGDSIGNIHKLLITTHDLSKLQARKRPNAWLPGRYMLASFARYYIRITAIRSEQLQYISEADAIAEGIEEIGQWYRNYLGTSNFLSTAVQSFQSLWQSIHGTESWAANPEVWVIEFENCEKPEQ